MSYTKFGEFMRIQRVKNHESMRDTAELFGVAVSFVSIVENGRRNVPKEWIPTLVEHYNLNAEEQAELQEAVELSKTQVKIDLTNATPTQRKLAVLFQHTFNRLDEATTEAIIKLLTKKRCSVCGRKIVWEHPDVPGLFLVSSDNIPDWPICHTCMVEHCCSTDCSKCEYGKEPSCEFQYLKDAYQDLSD